MDVYKLEKKTVQTHDNQRKLATAHESSVNQGNSFETIIIYIKQNVI